MLLKIINGANAIDFYSDTDIRIVTSDGLGMECTVNTAAQSVTDGESFISAKLPARQIDINFRFRKQSTASTAKARLYSVCAPKKEVIIEYNNGIKAVKTTGYITACDMPPNAFPFVGTVSIKCADPHLYDLVTTKYDLCTVTPLLKFPLSLPATKTYKLASVSQSLVGTVNNTGAMETGAIFTLTARALVTAPRLTNTSTFEWIEISQSFNKGDSVIIDTRTGHKSVKLVRGGQTSDLLGWLTWGSTFLQLAPGSNNIAISASSGASNLSVSASVTPIYGGA